MSANRNGPCQCGSGAKYKHCCAGKKPWYKQSRMTGIMAIVIVLGSVLVAALALTNSGTDATAGPPGPPPPGKVWSPEHGHWHDAP
jgi:hypothetical protein